VQGRTGRITLADGQPDLPASLPELLDVALAGQGAESLTAARALLDPTCGVSLTKTTALLASLGRNTGRNKIGFIVSIAVICCQLRNCSFAGKAHCQAVEARP
jgi:hypothetical protein